jgi:hypothetical protein
MKKQMSRHEMWQAQYRTRRYMEHLKNEDLDQRIVDIIHNLYTINSENQISLLPPERGGAYWMELWTHILEESALRRRGLDGNLHEKIFVPDLESQTAAKACEIVKRLRLEDGKYIFKYGNKKYLEPSLDTGTLRISPASSYNDPSLNKAIQDKELEFDFQYPPSEFRMEAFDHKTGQSKGIITPIDGKITSKWTTDFYVYCMSYAFNAKLFLDFDFDACLIISNPIQFLNELTSEFEIQNHGHTEIGALVKYCDPLLTPLSSFSLDFCKHFRYTYQKEVRVSWLPRERVEKLSNVSVRLPNLKQYSRLVKLDTI